jgi:hypothetical protein
MPTFVLHDQTRVHRFSCLQFSSTADLALLLLLVARQTASQPAVVKATNSMSACKQTAYGVQRHFRFLTKTETQTRFLPSSQQTSTGLPAPIQHKHDVSHPETNQRPRNGLTPGSEANLETAIDLNASYAYEVLNMYLKRPDML